jgi:hypothetical protein
MMLKLVVGAVIVMNWTRRGLFEAREELGMGENWNWEARGTCL